MEYRDLNAQEGIVYYKNYRRILEFIKLKCELHCQIVSQFPEVRNDSDPFILDLFYNENEKELLSEKNQNDEIYLGSISFDFTLKNLNTKYLNLYFIDNFINEEKSEKVNYLKTSIRNIKLDSINGKCNSNSDNPMMKLASNQVLFDKLVAKCSLQDKYKLELFFEYFKEFYKYYALGFEENAQDLADEFHYNSWIID